MNLKLFSLALFMVLVLSNATVAQNTAEDSEVKNIQLKGGNATLILEGGNLQIIGKVNAYPEANLLIREASDDENTGAPDNSTTREFELIYEKPRGIESIYKEEINVTRNLTVQETTDILLKYRESEAERELGTIKSIAMVTLNKEDILSVEKENYGSENQRKELQKNSSYSNNGTTFNDQSSIESVEVSQEYINDLDNMSRQELENRAIYLRSKVIRLERAIVDISGSLNSVEDLIEADMEKNQIYPEEHLDSPGLIEKFFSIVF